jgi:hypothetical protein
MIDLLLLVLMLYAASGLALSLAIHVVSFTGLRLGDDALFSALFAGVFPMLLMVILIAWHREAAGELRNDDYWELVLAGCPRWLRYAPSGSAAYCVALAAIANVLPESGPAVTARGVSAVLMVFYVTGLAVATAAWCRRRRVGLWSRCPNGHGVIPAGEPCPACAADVSARQIPKAG